MGGKKAAIQFAYDLRKMEQQGSEPESPNQVKSPISTIVTNGHLQVVVVLKQDHYTIFISFLSTILVSILFFLIRGVSRKMKVYFLYENGISLFFEILMFTSVLSEFIARNEINANYFV